MATARTTKTAPKPTTDAAGYDFDAWSEEDEEKAIAALVPDVRYIIVEKKFVGRFTDGVVVEMPLSISLDDVDALQAEASSPVDQFKGLLTKVAGADVARQFSSHDLTETVIMAEKFFNVFQRVNKAAVPE